MMNQGAALQVKKEVSVEERVHKLSIIMKKAKEGDPQAIELLEQIDTLTK